MKGRVRSGGCLIAMALILNVVGRSIAIRKIRGRGKPLQKKYPYGGTHGALVIGLRTIEGVNFFISYSDGHGTYILLRAIYYNHWSYPKGTLKSSTDRQRSLWFFHIGERRYDRRREKQLPLGLAINR